ncbi:class I SAM-dependent methyltransferase [Shivajiella indica]|uniref:Class I SAM-dependent methyltransferase n=1 Tax=Shivajiella indica TaxID=872115 RepID=A0ABW5BG55_9BACT
MLIDKQLKCGYCGNRISFNRHHVKEMMFGSGQIFEYAECLGCGSLYQPNIPENLSEFYPKNYYSFKQLERSSPIKMLLKTIRYQFFRNGLTFLKPFYGDWLKFTKVSKHSKIADLGCGHGQLLYELFASGFRNLEGYDPYIEKEVIINPYLTLFNKSVFEMKGKYDLIMMHHAFEHMVNYAKAIEKCFSLLNPGGYLLIRVPVTDAQVWKEEGVNWVQLDAPRHLTIPSTKGLIALAKSIGFSVKGIVFDSTSFQFWGTELYKKGIPLKEGEDKLQAIFKSELKEFHKKALLYNKKGIGDQACLYFYRAF